MSAAWKRWRRGNHQSGKETREMSAGLDKGGESETRAKRERRRERPEKPRKPQARDA